MTVDTGQQGEKGRACQTPLNHKTPHGLKANGQQHATLTQCAMPQLSRLTTRKPADFVIESETGRRIYWNWGTSGTKSMRLGEPEVSHAEDSETGVTG